MSTIIRHLFSRPAKIIGNHFSNQILSLEEVQKRTLTLLNTFNKISPERIKAESKFTEIGLDSLDTVEYIMALEEEFCTEIPDIDADNLQTPADAAIYIHKKLCEPI